MNIGENIIKLRKEKKLTQEELANLVCVSPKTVSSWEKNRNLPNIETLILLADIFDTDINNILAHKMQNTKELNTAYKKQAFKNSFLELLIMIVLLMIPVLYFIVAINNGIDVLKYHINNDTIITMVQLNAAIDYINSYIYSYFVYILIIISLFILYNKNCKILFTMLSGYLLISSIFNFYHFVSYHYYSSITVSIKMLVSMFPIMVLTILGIVGTFSLWKKYIHLKRTKK